MASQYGPWTSPPACNSTLQCNILLRLTNPQATGIAACYSSLLPENISASDVLGGCACNSWFALGGPGCNEQTEASPSLVAVGIIGSTVCFLVIVRFLKTLVGVLTHPAVWKLNAAGTTYCFTWVALISSLVCFSSMATRAFSYSERLLPVITVSSRVMIIFLSVAVINLAAAFIEMSSSVRLINNVSKLRVPMLVLVMLISCVLVFTYLFADATIAAVMGFLVALLLAILAIIAPIVLYVRASKRLVSTMGLRPASTCELLMAIVGEICLGDNRMKKLLNLGSSQSDNESRDVSPPNSPVHATIPEMSASASQISIIKRAAATTDSRIHVSKAEEKLISFLSRAVRMGFWLFISLMGFLIAITITIVYISQFETGAYRTETISQLLQDISISSALYQILWFLNPNFANAIAETRNSAAQRSTNNISSKLSHANSKEEICASGSIVIHAATATDLHRPM